MNIRSVIAIMILTMITLSALIACSDVQVFSQRNPQWQGQPLKKVMVIGNFESLVYRHYAEGQMCEYIRDYSDTECLESLKYLFAGQNEAAQIAPVLDQQKVDGVIYMSTQAHGTTVVDQPMILSTVQWAPGFFTTIGSGGPKVVDWANYSVELFVPNGALIWHANADASGDPYNTIEHSSKRISQELVKDGLISPGGSRNYKP